MFANASLWLRAVTATPILVWGMTGTAQGQTITQNITVSAPSGGGRQLWIDPNPDFPGMQACTRDTMPGDAMVLTPFDGPMPCDFVVDIWLMNLAAYPTPYNLVGVHFLLHFDPLVVAPVGVDTPAFFGMDDYPGWFVPPGSPPGTVKVVTTVDMCPPPGGAAGGIPFPIPNDIVASFGFKVIGDGQTGIDGSAVELYRVPPGPCSGPGMVTGVSTTFARSQMIVNHVGPQVGCWTVNRTSGGTDISVGNGISDANSMLGIIDSTLAACISEANSRSGADGIAFDISPPNPPPLITLTALLPVIGDTSGGLFIDGNSQPGVEISGLGPANGFAITSEENTIRGLSITKFTSAGISITGPGAFDNEILGNQIGVSWMGAILANGAGVKIANGAHDNRIGGSGANDGNTISGNSSSGVAILGTGVPSDAPDNVILGNYIGLDQPGFLAQANGADGIFIDSATGTQIGGTTPNERNLISGNGSNGIQILNNAEGTLIRGNFIGTDFSGNAKKGNFLNGVHLDDASGVMIGGAGAAANVISGNSGSGVVMVNPSAANNVVQGNLIGLGVNGNTALGNGSRGVRISTEAHDNLIGGPGLGNVISSNGVYGVLIELLAEHNQVQSNIIGLNQTATVKRANARGVGITTAATCNEIGGTADTCIYPVGNESQGNIIAGNINEGVELDTGAIGNLVSYNRIGLNAQNTALGNGSQGVEIRGGAVANWVAHNIIGSNLEGIRVTDPGTDANQLMDNLVGLSNNGNLQDGIHVLEGAQRTGIGGNQIRANFDSGVHIRDPETDGTVLALNAIELNHLFGVFVELEAAATVISGNGISDNDAGGIAALGAGHVLIEENEIFFNGADGVISAAGGVQVVRNSIYDNDQLGIDRAVPNATVTLTEGAIQVCGLTVEGTISGAASSSFTIEVFDNDVCDTGGFGEGKRYLGTADAATGPDGNGSFTLEMAADCELGYPLLLTALATDVGDNTSEFSNCLLLAGAPTEDCPADLNDDGIVDGADFGLLLAEWGACDKPCPADLNGDGVVDGADLGLLLAEWGPCP